MSWISAAIGIGSAVVGAGAAVYAGSRAASAEKDATAALSESQAAALETQWRMHQESRGDLAPWREAGERGLAALEQGAFGGRGPEPPGLVQARQILANLEQQVPAGPEPGAPPPGTVTRAAEFDWAGNEVRPAETTPLQPFGGEPEAGGLNDQIQAARDEVARLEAEYQEQPFVPGGPGEFIPEEQPGYKFGFEEFVQKPYLSSQAAKGKRLSGETLKGLTRYASDYASTKYNTFLDRYYKKQQQFQNIATMGQASAAGSAAGALNTGANIASLQQTGGQNLAQSATNRGNIATGVGSAVTGVAQSSMQNYLDYQALQRLSEEDKSTILNWEDAYRQVPHYSLFGQL